MRTTELLTLCLWAGCTFLTFNLGDGIRIASNVDLPSSSESSKSSESDSKTSLTSDSLGLGLTSGIHATLEVKVIPGTSTDTTKGIICVKNKSGRCIPVSSGVGGSNDNGIGKGTTKKPGPIIVSGFDDPVSDESSSDDYESDSESGEEDEDEDTKKKHKGGKRKKGTKVADVPVYLGLKGEPERRPLVPPNFGQNYFPNDRDYPQQGYPDHNAHDDGPYDPHYYPGPPYQQPNYPPSGFYIRNSGVYKRRRSGSDMPDYVSSRGRYSPETGFYGGYQSRYPGYTEQRQPGGSGGYYNNNRGWLQAVPSDRRGSDGYDASSWITATVPNPGLYARQNCDSDRRDYRSPVTTTDVSVSGKLGSVLEDVKEVRSI